jgi:hypothetical protein
MDEEAMPVIDISFDTYKQLTMRRTDETVTYDDVIRSLMKLPPLKTKDELAAAKKSWTHKGVTLSHGTELRARYKGAAYTARIDDGVWMQDGKARTSPSEAANAVTGTNINGWHFWEARLPGEDRWRLLNHSADQTSRRGRLS